MKALNADQREASVAVSDQCRQSQPKEKGANPKSDPPPKIFQQSKNQKQKPSIKRVWPDNLIDVIKEVVNEPEREPKAPAFKFEMNSSAAKENFSILSEHGMSLSKALKPKQHLHLIMARNLEQ